MTLQDIVPPLQHSLLPLPIDGSGQPLLSQDATSSFTVQVPIDEVGEKAVLEGQNMSIDMDSFRSRSCISRAGRYPSRLVAPPSSGVSRSAVSVSSGHRRSRTMASFTLLLLLAFPLLLLLLPPSLSGARTRLLSSRLEAPTMAFFPLLLPPRLHALMMEFFPLLPSTPVSLPLVPSVARALPPRARVCLRRLLLHPFVVRHPRPLGRIPFPFLTFPLHIFLHLFLITLLSSRLFLFLLPSLPALLASLHSLFLHNRQVAQCSVPCPFLTDIACHYVSLCRSLISPPSPSLHFPSATGEST